MSAHADPLADLDAADYAVREAATEALLTDDALTLEQVSRWLAEDLTLEQRHRLLGVARHVIAREAAAELAMPEGQRIALGFELTPTLIHDPTATDDAVSVRGDNVRPATVEANRLVEQPFEVQVDGGDRVMIPDLDLPEVQVEAQLRGGRLVVRHGRANATLATAPPGMRHAVLVVGTLPGLPAHGRLRAGDLIVALNGQPLHPHLSHASFADLVVTLPLGQPVQIDLIRDGQPRSLTVPTSTFDVLGQLYDGQPSRLRGLAAERWREFQASLD